jgi:Mg-chelatase subunit ChlI
VDIDLNQLREMHPKLGVVQALNMVELATLALERNAHTSGARVSLVLEQVLSSGVLLWPAADLSKIDLYDHNRITEDGAEAVALVLVHRHREWRVVRRIQHGEHADWLLEDCQGGVHERVALEVSGVDRGATNSRLTEKLIQVAKMMNVHQRWACVVGFEEPTAVLRPAEEQLHGY